MHSFEYKQLATPWPEFENLTTALNMERELKQRLRYLQEMLGAIFILRKGVFGLFQTTHPPTPVRNSKYFDLPPPNIT